MASSAVIFKGTSRYPKDGAIGTFLDLLQEELYVFEDGNSDSIDWLQAACKDWQKEWDEMPPGCKDIELDVVLTNLERQTLFCKFVDAILERIERDLHEPEFLVREITRVKELLQTN